MEIGNSTVFLLTDFSDHARNACIYAIDLFKNQVNYVLINTFQTREAQVTLINLEEMAFDESMSSLEQEKDWLLRKSNSLIPKYDVAVAVVGTKGRSNLESLLIGSNTKNIMRHVKLPVLSIPITAVFNGVKQGVVASEIKAVLGKSTVTRINKWKDFFNLNLKAVTVRGGNSPLSNQEIATIDKIVKQLEIKDFEVEENESVPLGLCKFIAAHDTDLLILIAKHTGFFNRIFHRSVTNEMLGISLMPILILEDN